MQAPKFVIDPQYPHAVLEDCASHLSLFADLFGQGAGDGLMIGETGLVALCTTLHAMSDTLQKVHHVLWERSPEGAAFLARTAAGTGGPRSPAAEGGGDRGPTAAEVLAASREIRKRGGADTLRNAGKMRSPVVLGRGRQDAGRGVGV